MTIHYNLNGAERKKLVTAVSQLLETKGKYQGAPTFAYQFGEYSIDMIGKLSGPDNKNLVADIQAQHGIQPLCEEYDIPAAEKPPGTWMNDPCKGPVFCTTEETPKTDDIAETNTLTIEMPLTGFDPGKLDNLCKMVTAKENLLKAALGAAELPIQIGEDTVKFPWGFSAEDTEAYTTFISLLCETAKNKKRVTAKERNIEGSPKYAFRCFLLSLGMIGAEYKNSRKVLLSRLDGNSSWKHGTPSKA